MSLSGPLSSQLAALQQSGGMQGIGAQQLAPRISELLKTTLDKLNTAEQNLCQALACLDPTALPQEIALNRADPTPTVNSLLALSSEIEAKAGKILLLSSKAAACTAL